jgi:hypothetical protein
VPSVSIEVSGFMLVSNTLTEPVWDTVNRDLARMVSNLKLVAFILKKKKKTRGFRLSRMGIRDFVDELKIVGKKRRCSASHSRPVKCSKIIKFDYY